MLTHSALPKPASQRPVLLVVSPSGVGKWAEVDQVMERIRTGLDPAVQIMRITDTTHPEVVRSFNFNALPAFVLLQQGQELWWHTGQIDSPDIFHELYQQVEIVLHKTIKGSQA
ncbi:thioredoxin domain-containing protein [Spirosoma pulveris]